MSDSCYYTGDQLAWRHRGKEKTHSGSRNRANTKRILCISCIICLCFTNVEGLWSLFGEHIKDLLGVWDSVGNSQIFVPAAQLRTDIIQSYPLVAITL